MLGMIETCVPELPAMRPRYLMGVGLPSDLAQSVARGIDMFDCVIPTRNARNGTLFTSKGRLRIKNAIHAEDLGPIDPDCACKTCRQYHRAYLRHLFQTNELLGLHLATYHNVFYYLQLMRTMRQAIIEGRFRLWQEEFLSTCGDS
jgi:queuine tRNA-ribosyltransferase